MIGSSRWLSSSQAHKAIEVKAGDIFGEDHMMPWHLRAIIINVHDSLSEQPSNAETL